MEVCESDSWARSSWIVTTTTRTRTVHVGLTETTETALPEAWTITLPHKTRMMIHDVGGTMESEMIG